MPDNWWFVFAAYAVAALVLGGYWRRLVRRERELAALAQRRRAAPVERRPAVTDPARSAPR